MGFLLLVYFIAVLYLIFLWAKVLEKYRNPSWLFFLLFSISTAAWFASYIASYFSTVPLYLLESLIKISYSSSIVSLYSFIFFIHYFSKVKKWLFEWKSWYIVTTLLVLVLFYIATPYVISWLYFDVEKQDYYETEWGLYSIHILLSLASLPMMLFITWIKLRTLQLIDKVRLIYILVWMVSFYLLTFIFVLLLPLVWVRTLEKEVIIFFFPFLFLTNYAIFSYHFSDIRMLLWKFISFSAALFCSIFILYYVKHLLFSYWLDLKSFWWISLHWTIFDIGLCIIIFFFLYKIFCAFLKTWENVFNNKILKIKEKLISFTAYESLNLFLSQEFYTHLNISSCKLYFWDDLNDNVWDLKSFFSSKNGWKIFINDIVFIEENKLNKKNKYSSLDKEWYIYFPIFDNNKKIISVFQMWQKVMKDNYSTEEINILLDFVKFLEIHLNYMSLYSKIQELNFELDKRVDEKTIQYNALISKLKEFIQYASHEIRAPLANSILLIDCLFDDLKTWKNNKKHFTSELETLNSELSKAVTLVKSIFSTEMYDMDKVKLFKEEVPLTKFLKEEFQIITKVHKWVVTAEIPDGLGTTFLDKIQTRELLNNLVNNALKYSNKDAPKVQVSISKNTKECIIDIEDNGEWFIWVSFDTLFQKYSTGTSSWIWLWMGLYLCKKISDLHGWKIQAQVSQKLWWAKFTIVIPN